MIGADEAETLLKGYFKNNSDLKDQLMNLLYSREETRRLSSWYTKPISEFSLSSKHLKMNSRRLQDNRQELLCVPK